jgi:hypothetical protein
MAARGSANDVYFGSKPYKATLEQRAGSYIWSTSPSRNERQLGVDWNAGSILKLCISEWSPEISPIELFSRGPCDNAYLRDFLRRMRQPVEAPLAKWRKQIMALSSMEEDWDSYGAGAPSALSIEIALEILDILEAAGTEPEYILPTSDESILFKYQLGDINYLWEIESDGEIGLMIEMEGENPTFHGLDRSQILNFFDESESNV